MQPTRPRSYVFGSAVLGLRERLGLTQAALGQLLGVSARAVLNWESGGSYPEAARLRQLIQLGAERGAFPAGAERAAATELWQTAARHGPRRMPPPDLTWLETLGGAAANLPPPQASWQTSIPAAPLYGRTAELATLSGWHADRSCHVIALLGIGGSGKTALAAAFARQPLPDVSARFWRSLWHAPPLSELLDGCLQALADELPASWPTDLDQRIAWLIALLQRRRCLIVLDNLETLLVADSPSGAYRPGYEAYGLLFERIAASPHQSCVVLTSRERPLGFAALGGPAGSLRTMLLGGLDSVAARTLLASVGLTGADQALDLVAARYAHQPLALKLAAALIQELFGGEIGAWSAADAWLTNDVRELLEQQTARLAPIEHHVLLWLAVARTPLTIAQLLEQLAGSVPRQLILRGVEGLLRRSLAERHISDGTIALQPVVLEYLTAVLIETVSTELRDGRLDILRAYPLAQALAPDYVRQSQLRLLADPVIDALRGAGSQAAVRSLIKDQLHQLRTETYLAQGYASSNLVVLLTRLDADLTAADLSGLALRQLTFSDMLLQRANLQRAQITESVFTEPFDTVASVAYSPDGSAVVSGAYNGDLRVWHAASGVLIGQCRGHTGGIHSVAWDPCGRWIASAGSEPQVWLWSAATQQMQARLLGPDAPVRSVVFSPDGTLLAGAGSDGVIWLWSLPGGACIGQTSSAGVDIYALAFDPAGTLLASAGSDGHVRLWEVPGLASRGVLLGHQSTVFALAFSPDGQRLASGSHDQTLRIWDWASQRCTAVLSGQPSSIQALAWSAHGYELVSGAGDGTIRRWEVASGACRQLLLGHTGVVCTLAYHPDGRTLISGSADRTLRVWDLQRNQCQRVIVGTASDIYAVAFHPNGRQLASGGGDGAVRLWDRERPTRSQTLRGHSGDVFSVAFSPDGRWLASSGDDATLLVWAVSGAPERYWSRAGAARYALSWSPDGTLLASSADSGQILVWEAATGRLRATLTGHTSPVRALAWSPDGRWLASGGYDRHVRLWSVTANWTPLLLTGHTDFVFALAWSPDGRWLASGGYDRVIRVWDRLSASAVWQLTGHTSPVRTLAWSPDGGLLASGGYDPLVTIWSAERWQQQRLVDGTQLVFSLAWSPDGTTLAVGRAGGVITCWDRATSAETIRLHAERPYEGVRLTGAVGLSEPQRTALLALGALIDG